MAVLTAGVAELPRAAEIAKLRAAIDQARGYDLMRARGDFRWCMIDRAHEIQTDLGMLELAIARAELGDEDAAAALALADDLSYDETPSSFYRPSGSGVVVGTQDWLDAGEFRSALAAHRRRGSSFAVAWQTSITLVKPADLAALQWSRSVWRSAYYREVAPPGWSLPSWG